MLKQFKQHFNKEFFYLISSIRKMTDKNQQVLLLKVKSDHIPILQILLNEGFITSFQNYKGFIVINNSIVKENKNQKRFNFIDLSKRIGRRNYTITFNDLLKLQRREGGTAYFILNTDKGLLTSFNAIDLRVGGQLLLKIS